jgi:hypothetical protein
MDKTRKGGNATPESGGKGKNFSFKRQVLEILVSGQEVTAWGFNKALMSNDARKAISDLRKAGYPIRDFWQADRRKVYYLPAGWKQIMYESGQNKQNDKQLKMFYND